MAASTTFHWTTLGRALRSLRRSPGFVAIAAVSLGTALGLSTAVFAMMDAMTHPESAFRNADQLFAVLIFRHSRLGPAEAEVRQSLAQFAGADRVSSFRTQVSEVLAGDAVEEREIVYVRPGLFELLGALARLGRLPTSNQDAAEQVAVVSDGLWRRGFENRRTIGVATVDVGDRQYRVIGVLPGGASLAWAASPDVWIMDPTRDAAGTPVIRVRGGFGDTLAVQAQLQSVFQRWSTSYSTSHERPFSGRLFSMRPDPLELRDFHRALVGAAGCVLLIACANVAALMLARGMVRRRDYALRLALGAGRGEIAREVMVEVAVLAVVGSVFGAMLSTWIVGLITRAMPDEMHSMGFVPPQWRARVLALSALAVLVSVSVAGGVPAWRASRANPMGPLKESGGGTTGRAGTRFRWLVMAELALSMTLVMGASLMLKSRDKMASYDFGYEARGLLHLDLMFLERDSTPPAKRDELLRASLERMRSLPDVRSVAAEGYCVTSHNSVTSDLTLPGAENTYVNGGCTGVGDQFFQTIGMRLLQGRDFSPGDAKHGAVILGEREARRLFRHEAPLGRSVKLGPLNENGPWYQVVGIVRDQSLWFNPFPETGPDTSETIYAYIIDHPAASPYTRYARYGFVVRPRERVRNVESDLTRTVSAGMPKTVRVMVQPWQRSFYEQLHAEQFLTLVFALLGAASLALGAAGLFSVISYVAGQRMREFAVRLALGATRDNVLRLVLREGLVMALGGTAVGAGLGMWAGFLLWDKMWGVYPVDAGALVAGEVTLLLVTMAACLAPALRATRADPVEILRSA